MTLAGAGGARLLLAKAEERGRARCPGIGDQTGGRVFLFLETDDLPATMPR